MSRRRSPVPVAGAVEALKRQLEPKTPLAAVQRHWEDAVGPHLARHAEPIAERGGVVTVLCRSAAWANDLQLMSADIVAALNANLGAERVSALRCTATPPRGAARRRR